MSLCSVVGVVEDGLCTGCGTCIALCPVGAISLDLDRKNTYFPNLNLDKCKSCGKCYEVCPGHEFNFDYFNLKIYGEKESDKILGHLESSYIGHSKTNYIRKKSSSGGIFSELLIFALESGIIDGALVTRMKKDSPLEPEPFIARTKEEIIEASKSKYCPVPANIALKEIMESSDGEKFAVVGLPCHIHGIRKAEELMPELNGKIVLHLGIFCSYGINFLSTDYFLNKNKIDSSDIKEINYRTGKFPRGTFSLRLKSGKKVETPHPDFWHETFSLVTWFSPKRCVFCVDQSSELSDISIGSGWFPFLNYGKYNESIIVARSKIGKKILIESKEMDKISLSEINNNDMKKLRELQINHGYKKGIGKYYLNVARKFGKKTPYYPEKFFKPTFKAYLSYIFLNLRIFISSKKCFWGIIPLAIKFTKLLRI